MSIDFSRFRNPDIRRTMTQHFDQTARLYNLGTPILSVVDRIVTTVSMKVGTYTVAAQPDVPRNITVSHTIVATGTDTLGTITVAGTDINGAPISEVITPVAGATAAGLLAFKTVTAITGAGWAIAGGNDTITVGVGDLIGLPVVLASATNILMGIVGTALVVPTVAIGDAVSANTVNLASGTYDGSKRVSIFLVE